MGTYTKRVSNRELQFYIRASDAGIAPPILGIKSGENQKYDLITQKMPIVLIDVMRTDLAKEILIKASDLVDRLHEIGILHNDLSEENIVYDPETERVYLIDFGLSREISSIQEEEIPDMIENLYEGVEYATIPESNSIEYLKSVELGIITFLLENQTAPKFDPVQYQKEFYSLNNLSIFLQ